MTATTKKIVHDSGTIKAELKRKLMDITIRKTGLTPTQLANLSEEEEKTLLIKKNGTLPAFKTEKNMKKLGRGNPLLSKRKFRTIEYIDSRIDKLCK